MLPKPVHLDFIDGNLEIWQSIFRFRCDLQPSDFYIVG